MSKVLIICRNVNKYLNEEYTVTLDYQLMVSFPYLPPIGSSLVIEELLYRIYDIVIEPKIKKENGVISNKPLDDSSIYIYCNKVLDDNGQHKRFTVHE